MVKKAYRISYNRWYTDEVFAEHLDFIKSNLDIIDEVVLIREFSHTGHWPLEGEWVYTDIVSKRIQQYKAAGVKRVGVNVMSNIGHIDEAWDVLPRLAMQPYVGSKGEESKSCFCYSRDEFVRYLTERYKIIARTRPDFIWLDDDLRVQNHGARDGCYCPHCIREFNEQYAYAFDRAALVQAVQENNVVRANWDAFRRENLIRLIAAIKDAIRSIAPDIVIGFMGTWAAQDLVDAAGAEMCRPGGDFYCDDTPREMLKKSYNIQYQIKTSCRGISDIQYEYEAFPYITLQKSAAITELESAVMVMSGCNGIAYNAHHRDDNRVVMRGVSHVHKLLDQMECFEYKNAGVYCGANLFIAQQLLEIGIPVTADAENAQTAMLLGGEWNNYTDSEVRAFLSKSVFTDGSGLKALTDRGFGQYCGGSIKAEYTNGMAERFSAHRLNGDFRRQYRDVFMNFFHSNVCHSFEPADDAECLSHMETIDHTPLDCSMYLYRNELGGKIVVDGYLQPAFIRSEAKRFQLMQVLDELANGALPAMIDKCCKVAPFVRTSKERDIKLLLANFWFDDTGEITCRVQTTEQMYIVGCDGEKTPARQIFGESDSTVILDNIKAWGYVALTTH